MNNIHNLIIPDEDDEISRVLLSFQKEVIHPKYHLGKGGESHEEASNDTRNQMLKTRVEMLMKAIEMTIPEPIPPKPRLDPRLLDKVTLPPPSCQPNLINPIPKPSLKPNLIPKQFIDYYPGSQIPKEYYDYGQYYYQDPNVYYYGYDYYYPPAREFYDGQ